MAGVERSRFVILMGTRENAWSGSLQRIREFKDCKST